ncbi:MAG: hypothetical protein QOH19_1675 [Actinomycetota bacterium]|nr:hypothetical protein [Actinomycetota bacterium]
MAGTLRHCGERRCRHRLRSPSRRTHLDDLISLRLCAGARKAGRAAARRRSERRRGPDKFELLPAPTHIDPAQTPVTLLSPAVALVDASVVEPVLPTVAEVAPVTAPILDPPTEVMTGPSRFRLSCRFPCLRWMHALAWAIPRHPRPLLPPGGLMSPSRSPRHCRQPSKPRPRAVRGARPVPGPWRHAAAVPGSGSGSAALRAESMIAGATTSTVQVSSAAARVAAPAPGLAATAVNGQWLDLAAAFLGAGVLLVTRRRMRTA